MKSVEWVKVDGAMAGRPPCPRIGHSMNFLPITKSIIIVGGRNDELCKGLDTPYLNDVYIFSLELNYWH